LLLRLESRVTRFSSHSLQLLQDAVPARPTNFDRYYLSALVMSSKVETSLDIDSPATPQK
jgi:hypothetical protein